MKHLKPHQHYIDLYDRHTVEECSRIEDSFGQTDTPLPEDGSVTPEQARRIKEYTKKWYLRTTCGERYLNKSKTIRDWMDNARNKDELLESAQAPTGIRCLACRNIVKPTFKDLCWTDIDKPDRVFFMYDCANQCMPRRAFFSDGEEWRVKPDLCPRCDVPLTLSNEDDGKKLVTTRTCTKCGHTDKSEYEWSKKEEEAYDPNFSADRDRFCYTEEGGVRISRRKVAHGAVGKACRRDEKDGGRTCGKTQGKPQRLHT